MVYPVQRRRLARILVRTNTCGGWNVLFTFPRPYSSVIINEYPSGFTRVQDKKFFPLPTAFPNDSLDVMQTLVRDPVWWRDDK